MTARQRFNATMAGQPVDHVPWLEEGLRDDVLEQWREQGMAGRPEDHLPYDRREAVGLDLSPPKGMAHLPDDAESLRALSVALDPADPCRWPADWSERAAAGGWRDPDREHILQLSVHSGLFLTLGADRWNGLENLWYRLADEPEFVRESMLLYGHLAARMIDRVTHDAQFDFATFSEPIATTHGPLLSPAMYSRVVLDSYRPAIAALKRGGVQSVVFMTYANSAILLDKVLEAGFDCLWAIETDPAAMDYSRLRQRYGNSLRLIGGIDLDCLYQGPAAIEHEMRTKLPPLLAQGCFIPLADARVRKGTPWANYRFYRELLMEMTTA